MTDSPHKLWFRRLPTVDAPTVDFKFLIAKCGFALARPHWYGVTEVPWQDLTRTCVSADTREELVAMGAFNIKLTKEPTVELCSSGL